MPRPWEPGARSSGRPNIEQLKKQAKELVKAHAHGDVGAMDFVQRHHPTWGSKRQPGRLRLSDAQWAVARHAGERSWPALVRRVEHAGTPDASAPGDSDVVSEDSPPVEGAPSPSEATVLDDVPMLPLRALVVFPGQRAPAYVGRGPSMEAIERALSRDGRLGLVTQIDAQVEQPRPGDVYSVGTLAEIVAVLRIDDPPSIKLQLEGRQRVRVEQFDLRGGYWSGRLRPWPIESVESVEPQLDTLWREVVAAFEVFARERDGIPHRVVWQVQQVTTARAALSLLLGQLGSLATPVQQQILEAADLNRCWEALRSAFEVDAQEP